MLPAITMKPALCIYGCEAGDRPAETKEFDRSRVAWRSPPVLCAKRGGSDLQRTRRMQRPLEKANGDCIPDGNGEWCLTSLMGDPPEIVQKLKQFALVPRTMSIFQQVQIIIYVARQAV